MHGLSVMQQSLWELRQCCDRSVAVAGELPLKCKQIYCCPLGFENRQRTAITACWLDLGVWVVSVGGQWVSPSHSSFLLITYRAVISCCPSTFQPSDLLPLISILVPCSQLFWMQVLWGNKEPSSVWSTPGVSDPSQFPLPVFFTPFLHCVTKHRRPSQVGMSHCVLRGPLLSNPNQLSPLSLENSSFYLISTHITLKYTWEKPSHCGVA